MRLVGGIDALVWSCAADRRRVKEFMATHTLTHTHTEGETNRGAHTSKWLSSYPAYQEEAHLRLARQRLHKFIKLLPVISIMHL